MKKLFKTLLAVAAVAVGTLVFSGADSEAAVSNVKQTDASTSSVSISWKGELGAKNYVVELRTDNSSWVPMKIGSSTSPSIDNLSSGETYYVRIGALSEYVSVENYKINPVEPTSGWSEEIELVTAPNVDNATLVQTGATTKSVTLKASDVPGANQYIISSGSYSEFNVIGQSSNAEITTSKILTPGTGYTVFCYPCRVAASTGFVARKDYVSAYGVKTVAKKAGTNNFGFRNAWYYSDDYQIGLDGTLGTYDGVQVQLQSPSGKTKKSYTGSGSYAEIKGLNGTFYRYRIRTYVDCGTYGKVYSAWSGFKYVGLTSKGTLTSQNKKIKASWKKVKNASGYTVYISLNENSGFKKVKTLSGKKASLTIQKYGKSKLKKGKRYYVRVIAKAKCGKKTYNSDLSFSGGVTIY